MTLRARKLSLPSSAKVINWADIKKPAKTRIGHIVAAAEKYNKKIDAIILTAALEFSSARFAARRIPTLNDEFSDPLLIAEKLVEWGQADQTTLIASILYPSVRPATDMPIDENGLNEIETQFGIAVKRLVLCTLRLRALTLPGHMKSEADRISSRHPQPEKERLNDFRLMALWTAEDPGALLIRGSQCAVLLDSAYQTADHEKRAWFARAIEDIYAPLMDAARLRKVRDHMLNGVLRLKEPGRYGELRQLSDKLSDKDNIYKVIEIQIAKYLAQDLGLGPEHYIFESRTKEPHALAHNQGHKNIQDWLGMRIIFNEKAIDLLVPTKPSSRIETDDERMEKLKIRENHVCQIVYNAISKRFGRASRLLRDLYTKEQWQNRFKDHIRNEKDNGYGGVLQDAFFIVVKGVLKEIEGIVSSERCHVSNQYGPRAGHVIYKMGMQPKQGSVLLEWHHYAEQLLGGGAPGMPYVYVFTSQHDIYGQRGPMNVAEFAMHGVHKDVAARCVGAYIENLDPMQGREKGKLYDINTELVAGDRVEIIQGPGMLQGNERAAFIETLRGPARKTMRRHFKNLDRLQPTKPGTDLVVYTPALLRL